mgnify:FL=1
MLFQFHKGTIRTILVLLEIVRFSHFNSIKVQLEPLIVQRLSGLILFQFHKGTIRTLPAQRDIAEMTIFQFHKGTIRTRDPGRLGRYGKISIP